MPPVQPSAKVLVTGATGFIGAWTVRAFLERGYDVRGTVRSKSKGEWLGTQAWAQAAPGKFEYVIVQDIEAAGAFDEAVQGEISIVAHTASPVVIDVHIDPYALINPAVKGTVGVLNSIVNHGPSVKRVVITSSVATLIEPSDNPRIFTEEDWNKFSVKEIEAKGALADPMHKYRASKVMAEKAVWEFVEKHKAKVNFEVTTILPSFVYSPVIHEIPSRDKLNDSIASFYNNLRKEVPPIEDSLGNYVDVRDVSQMHVDAVENENAAGRFIACGGSFIYQDIYDALNAHPDPFTGVPIGTPGAGKNVKRQLVAYSNEKAKRLLGTKFTSIEDMAYDTVAGLKERGFWP